MHTRQGDSIVPTHRRASLLLAAAAVLVAAIAVPSIADGGRKTSVDGTWATTAAQVVDQQQLGPLLHLQQQGAAAFAEDLNGTMTFDLHAVIRADYSSFGWATEFFTGTWGDRAGTLMLVERASGAADGSVRVEAKVVNGTGALSGVRGELTFV